MLNFLKTPTDLMNWGWGFRYNLLDKFLYGYMQNNMGTYRLMTRYWPTPRNPEIIVTGGFPEFFATAIDQLGSRTVFLYGEVMATAFVEFI
jgi:hypothetical protein